MMYGSYANADTDLKDKYVIWSPGSSYPPKVVYDDRPTAIKVAHQMASRNPSQQFAVCKIVGSAKTATVKYESFEE